MKLMIYVGMAIGGALGSYLPVWLWGAGLLSGWSILGTTVGSLVGIWIGYKVYQNYSD